MKSCHPPTHNTTLAAVVPLTFALAFILAQ